MKRLWRKASASPRSLACAVASESLSLLEENDWQSAVRRIEGGEPTLLAATNGSREIGFAVIATTLTLVAVYAPVGLLPGTMGRLFVQFAVTLSIAMVTSCGSVPAGRRGLRAISAPSRNPSTNIFNLGKPGVDKTRFSVGEGVASISVTMKYM